MKIRWIRESQGTDWGLIKTGDEVDTAKRGIPKSVAKSWIKDGWAVAIKPKSKKISKKGGEK